MVEAIVTFSPRMQMVPLVTGTAPDSTLISVDLPAPLSPSSPTISRSSTVKVTSSSARTRP